MNGTADVLKTVNIIGELLLAAKKSYDEARRIAELAGVPPEVLAQSDARYAHTLTRTRPDTPTPPVTE